MYKYSTVTVVTDNGPYITKLILEAPVEMNSGMADKDSFNVYVERKNRKTGEIFMASKTWMGPKIYPSKGYRPVAAVYPCTNAANA
jgi:predicted peptidase